MKLSSQYSFVRDAFKQIVYAYGHGMDYLVLNEDAFEVLQNYQQHKDTHSDFFHQAAQLRLLEPSGPEAVIRSVPNGHHLKRVQWELTLTCNLSCSHCYCSASPVGARGVDTATSKRVIDELAEAGVLYIDFTGGEPLVRKDLFELISYAKAKGVMVSLFTNATLVTEETAAKLASLKIESVQTSLDGITADVHDKIRRKRGSFEAAKRGIGLLKKHGITVTATVVITRSNIAQMAEFLPFFRDELGISFRLDRMIPSGRALQIEDQAVSNAEFYEAYRSNFGNNESLLGKVCEQSHGPSQTEFIEPGCGVGSNYLFIKNDGRVVLCPTMTESESPDFLGGNIREESLLDIWNFHPTFVRYRHMQCQQITVCPAAKSCRGGCRSNAYLLHGSIVAPDELECNRFKNTTGKYVSFIERYASGNH